MGYIWGGILVNKNFILFVGILVFYTLANIHQFENDPFGTVGYILGISTSIFIIVKIGMWFFNKIKYKKKPKIEPEEEEEEKPKYKGYCQLCKAEKVLPDYFYCKYCKKYHCNKHRLPEQHKCTGKVTKPEDLNLNTTTISNSEKKKK